MKMPIRQNYNILAEADIIAPTIAHTSELQTNETLEEATISWNIKELLGYTVQANDGATGKVYDFYFDDKTWTIRRLVVDIGDWVLETGAWIPGRKVVIPSIAFGRPYQEEHLLSTGLTKRQVELSLDLDIYKESWGHLHLYSLKELLGYYIQARDGDIGHVEDFIVDLESWHIHFIVVDTRNWWLGKKVMVIPAWIDSINSAESKVCVNLLRESIQSSPEFDATTLIFSEEHIFQSMAR